MRVTSKGQVTIPQEIREQAGFLPGTELEFQLGEDGVVRLHRRRTQPENTALNDAVQNLRGKVRGSMSTDEIVALTRG